MGLACTAYNATNRFANTSTLISLNKKAQSNNTRETESAVKSFSFTIKWLLILAPLAGAFWVTTNFPSVMAVVALVITDWIAWDTKQKTLGGYVALNSGWNLDGRTPRGWVAFCLTAALNGLWFAFTLGYQSSNSIFGDSPPWTRYLNFPALVLVESVIVIIVLKVRGPSIYSQHN